MKILTEPQQPTMARQAIDSRADKTESDAAGQKATAKRVQLRDTVELSHSPDIDLKSREAEQAKRVQAIKALVDAGRYQVSSHEVAKKMLSRI